MAEEPGIVPLPDDDERSVYANDFVIWHSGHDLAIDLRLLGPIDEEENARTATPVVRVRLPSTIVFPMIRRMSAELGDLLGED